MLLGSVLNFADVTTKRAEGWMYWW